MTNSTESNERLDRLAAHLGRVVELLESGGTGVAMKDQLIALQRVVLDVVKDTDLEPTTMVQRDVVSTAFEPGPEIPRPFRPIDVSALAADRR